METKVVPQSLWIQRLSRPSDATIRLICFPHAGGSASAYRGWPTGLASSVEVLGVQYPGRGPRLRETPVDRVPVMANAVADALSHLPALPTVFFGHSLGGAVAFEVVRCLAEAGAPLPQQLFVSSRSAPDLPSSCPPISHLPDADFLQEIGRLYAAVPPQLLDYPDVLELLVPALRADMAAIEHYRGSCVGAVACPITAFGGSDDATTAREQLEAWRRLTMGSFRLRMFPGGHFYLDSQRQALLDDISASLAMIVAEALTDRAA